MKPLAGILTAGHLAALLVLALHGTAAEPSTDSKPPAIADSSSVAPGQHPPGASAQYVLEGLANPPASVVASYSLTWGSMEKLGSSGDTSQWLLFDARKAGGETLRVWFLGRGYPPASLAEARKSIARYIVQAGNSAPREFRDPASHEAVLPTSGGWPFLVPRPVPDASEATSTDSFPAQALLLGHRYRRSEAKVEGAAWTTPDAGLTVTSLPTDRWIGVPSNTRQKDETRRYDGTEYEYVPLTRADFREMADAGINCFQVSANQLPWLDDLDAYYWGINGAPLRYPDCLYDSRYIGPALFLDEPAVTTRDSVIRPRLAKDDAYRKAITPQDAFESFRAVFQHSWHDGAARSLLAGLSASKEFDIGNMQFLQGNLFSWETLESAAAYELSQNPGVPSATVFEPPGRIGTRRTLPELDMTYGCQIPTGDPRNFIDIIYGFLRGAARLTGKEWGMSIYGAVERADAPWFFTHAYDLGATRFFMWDNAQLACVPYHECLSLARAVKMRADDSPHRDLEKLRQAAAVCILLPVGYNLGHVQLGKGSLWGVGELNLERRNQSGVTYRTVMSNLFTEIERCLRLGIAFDLLWDLPGIEPTGYQEIVRVREDGKVEIINNDGLQTLDQARIPPRPAGEPPGLKVEVTTNPGNNGIKVSARAEVTETTAPVYYTLGADHHGVYHNAMVAWELYGPNEEDYRPVQPAAQTPRISHVNGRTEAEVEFKLERPGKYRLRAGTVDVAGRSTIVWTPIENPGRGP